jgi:hypothetical protein
MFSRIILKEDYASANDAEFFTFLSTPGWRGLLRK